MITRFDIQKLQSALALAQKILITSHKNCGDATGSVIAAMLALKALGKEATMFLPAPVPATFRFLPFSEFILHDSETINLEDYDLLFCVDAAEVAMTGLADKWQARSIDLVTINLDHHHTNPSYGDINIVYKQASATAIILYDWFKQAEFPITREMATCLLTGILTDTGSFSNPGTTAESLQAAAEMLLKGARVNKIFEQIIRNKSINDLKLWGRALERLHVNDELGLVTTVITQQDMDELDVDGEALEGIANFLNDLSGFKATLVLKEQNDGTIKGSLRTTRDDVDVAELAKLFGGGGHQKAAGFSIAGKLKQTDKGWEIVKE
ncbi:MAG: bifunctional oligoribonuclease/PAP phosphatase NrnA [Patescibacteria group bacterium]